MKILEDNRKTRPDSLSYFHYWHFTVHLEASSKSRQEPVSRTLLGPSSDCQEIMFESRKSRAVSLRQAIWDTTRAHRQCLHKPRFTGLQHLRNQSVLKNHRVKQQCDPGSTAEESCHRLTHWSTTTFDIAAHESVAFLGTSIT